MSYLYKILGYYNTMFPKMILQLPSLSESNRGASALSMAEECLEDNRALIVMLHTGRCILCERVLPRSNTVYHYCMALPSTRRIFASRRRSLDVLHADRPLGLLDILRTSSPLVPLPFEALSTRWSPTGSCISFPVLESQKPCENSRLAGGTCPPSVRPAKTS